MCSSDLWAIWVRDEDHLPRARQELEEFTRNPSDPRYNAAPRAADDLRQRRRQEDAAYHRRQDRFNRRMSGPIASQPWTVALIVACILVSLLSQGGHDFRIVLKLSITAPSLRITEGRIVPSVGLEPIWHGEVWRLVTPIFLHFGIWHLVFNMYWLYSLGGAIERRRGPLRYLTLILVVAVFSNLIQYYFGNPVIVGGQLKWPESPLFGGMSGVVYGLFGYIWMKARFQPELGLGLDPSTILIMILWLMLCMTPLMDSVIGRGVANGAHLGGLIAGMVLGYLPMLWSSSGSA